MNWIQHPKAKSAAADILAKFHRFYTSRSASCKTEQVSLGDLLSPCIFAWRMQKYMIVGLKQREILHIKLNSNWKDNSDASGAK